MFSTSIRLARAALVAVALAGPIPAAAHDTTIAQALARGDHATARRLVEAEVAGRPDAALHLAHLEGLIALRSGDPAAAADIFRAILSVAPGFAPSRAQLAVALDRLGRQDRAQRAAAMPSPVGRVPQGRDARPAQAAPAAPVPPAAGPAAAPAAPQRGVALRFAFLPSTNLTGGTRARTVDLGGLPFRLDPGSREYGGVGLTFGATAWQGWTLGDHWRATLSGSGDVRLYGNAPRPDEADLGLRFDLARGFDRGALSFGPRVALRFKDGHLHRRQAGAGLAGEYLFGPRLRLSAATEWLAQAHPDEPFRDGTLVSARLGLDWAASPQTVLSLELPALREDARAAHLSHTDIGLGIGLRHAFPSGLTIGAHAFAGYNRHDGVYAGFGTARRDRVQSLRVTLSDPRLRILGHTPEFSVTRRRQDSNIPLHDVWSTDVGLSFVRRF
ncbi:MAG: surface lipoprotein assembly modifier [Rhodobacteraceae bacterium]|jgi:hypothetical protein|nr:surface lipoprotein assembly modifier [Paracoccaceae bacterium]